jgi:hypothetical protein
MKNKYDFSNAEKGKFYRPLDQIELPIYLDQKVKDYYLNIARDKDTDLSKIINAILEKEMEIHKTIL